MAKTKRIVRLLLRDLSLYFNINYGKKNKNKYIYIYILLCLFSFFFAENVSYDKNSLSLVLNFTKEIYNLMRDTGFKNSYKEIKIQTCICFPTKTTKEKQSYKYISRPNDCKTHHQITNLLMFMKGHPGSLLY